MTNPSKKYKKRSVLTDAEISDMLEKADLQKNEYFKLRVKALIALLRTFGKRRIELALLKRSDLKIQGGNLHVTFTIAKKHKRGFFQYLQYLRKLVKKEILSPEALNKPLPELEGHWKEWQSTEEGHKFKTEERTKYVSLEGRYINFIVEYLAYLEKYYGNATFLFPSGVCYFGQGYIMNPTEHLTGRQLLRLIKKLNPEAWLHLFREYKAKEIAIELGRSMNAIFEVKETLDLEREDTALGYVRRLGEQEVRTGK